MEGDEQEVTLFPTEGIEVLAHQPGCHVGVQRLLLRAHRVLEDTGMALDKGNLKKFLGLAAKSPLKHRLQASPQFSCLLGEHRAVAGFAEDLAERRQPAEKRSRG